MPTPRLLFFLSTILSLYFYCHCQSIQVRSWVSEGYYYSHRCEVTVQIVSDYFENSYQLFHILAKQNMFFLNTTEIFNVFYVKGTNGMETMMTSSEKYCRFLMSEKYYCPFVFVTGADPLGLRLYEQVNSTHRRLTLRLPRTVCSAEGQVMSFRFQMPASIDYQQFYMFVPSITNSTPTIIENLTFVYDNEVTINTSLLSYKQVKSITFLPDATTFITGCKITFSIAFQFQNISYYNTWNQINIYITNQQSLTLSSACYSNLSLTHSCYRTQFGYRLVNLNFVRLNKSYEFSEQEYYEYEAIRFMLGFDVLFGNVGVVGVEAVVVANDNTVQEMGADGGVVVEVYGRKVGRLVVMGVRQFAQLNSNEGKYDPSKCMIPIIIDPTANSFTTNLTTNSSINSTTPTFPNYNPTIHNTITTNTSPSNFSLIQLIFLLAIVTTISLTLFFTQNFYHIQKIIYLLTIFLLSAAKLLYLVVPVDQTWLLEQDHELDYSLLLKSTDEPFSLELFMIKCTFIVQFFLNVLYLLNYFILIIFSQEIIARIKKFYGTTFYVQQNLSSSSQKQKIKNKKINFSVIIFTSVTLLTFLLSFKIYAFLLLKLQLNLNAIDAEFKKYRLKNPFIYKIHSIHLAIDLLLETNAIVWLFLLIQNSQNSLFTFFLYGLLLLYCLHLYLVAAVLKVFLVMAIKTDQLNSEQKNILKEALQNQQQKIDIDQNENKQTQQQQKE